MEEATINKLNQYIKALRALQRSVEQAIQNEMFQGTGKLAVKQYQGIQQKVSELVTDDFYITETLALELADSYTERELLGQVQMAADQMIIYLEGITQPENTGFNWEFSGDWDEFRDEMRKFKRGWREFGRRFKREFNDEVRRGEMRRGYTDV